MSTVKTNNVQLGQSVTATNNFTWYQPASPDGTVRLGNGNSGSVTDLVTLTSAGNLGLGVTPSGWALNVPAFDIGAHGSVYAAPSVQGMGVASNAYFNGTNWIYKTTGFASLYVSSTGQHRWFNAPSGTAANPITLTQAMALDASGNLGLGVTPSAWSGFKAIQVGNGSFGDTAGGSNNALFASNMYFDGANFKYINSTTATLYRQLSGQHQWYTAPSGTAGNAITFNQAMTLTASGELLVGVTSRTDTPANGMILQNLTGATQILLGHANGTVSGVYYSAFLYNSSIIGSITQNGTTGVLYNITSDQRLKENIVDAPNALSSINAIKVRSFDWKADGSHSEYGYIAQELLEVAPEAVHVPTDPEEMMGVDFGKLTPRLVKAIQELSAEIETLKQRIK